MFNLHPRYYAKPTNIAIRIQFHSVKSDLVHRQCWMLSPIVSSIIRHTCITSGFERDLYPWPSFSNEVEGRFPKPGCSRFSRVGSGSMGSTDRCLPPFLPTSLVWFLRQAKKCWISWNHVSILVVSCYIQCVSCCCSHFAGHIGIVVANIPMLL